MGTSYFFFHLAPKLFHLLLKSASFRTLGAKPGVTFTFILGEIGGTSMNAYDLVLYAPV